MIKKQKIATGILAATLLALGVPAMAEYYTTSDGAIVLDLPDKTWELVEDKENVTTLTNGDGAVAVLHYKADDELPTVTVPGEFHEASYSVVMADDEDVYVINGYATEKEYLSVVREIVQSACYYEDLPYAGSTTTDVTTTDVTAEDAKYLQGSAFVGTEEDPVESPVEHVYEITPMDAIMYAEVYDGLNIRDTYSRFGGVIGNYAYGESVYVIGNVKVDGVDTGWYQVGYEGMTGYVLSQYLNPIQPSDAPQEVYDSSEQYLTGEVVYIYNEDGSTTVIKEYTDGTWRDRMGYTYESTADGHWICQQ